MTSPAATLREQPSSIPHRISGKERDSESGNDYFGARYYASSMGRFMSPDWAAKQDPVPYAKLDNPQTLNLYAYLRNNPLAGVDADGHCNPNDWGCNSWSGSGNYAQAETQEQSKLAQQQAQQQSSNSSSNGTGFWSHVGNLLHGHSWNYGMRESVTVSILPAEPIPGITALTDAAGVISTATKNTPLGVVSAVGSVANDHSAQNVTTNAVGLIPGLGWQTGIMGAFIDFFDYGIHNSHPGPQKVGDPTAPNELQPTLPSQDGGCLAAGMDGPC